MKKRAEEDGKEHNFRYDKPGHAHAKGTVKHLTVHASDRFADHRSEPAEHHQDSQSQPNVEYRGAITSFGCHLFSALLDKRDRAEGKNCERSSPDNWPAA